MLTDDAIDVNDKIVLVPESPIEAITPGASIKVDVSKIIQWDDSNDILEFRRRVIEMFPQETMRAELVKHNKSVVMLEYHGAHEFTGDRVLLTLDSKDGVPTGVEFEYVVFRSDIVLHDVRIYWKNYQK